MALEIVQVQQSVLPTGAAQDTTVAAMSAKLPATIGQKAMAASLAVAIASDQVVPVSGTVAVSGTVPVSGTVAISGTTPVSAASLPLPTGAATQVTLAAISGQLPATLGQKVMAASQAVAIASDQGAVPVSGTVAVSGTTAVSAAALPLPAGASTEATLAATSAKLPATIGQKAMAASLAVAIASDQGAVPVSGPMTNAQFLTYSANLWVTATGAVNTAVTATLPAAGAGLFHYILSIKVTKLYSVVGVANGAGNIITSTNLNGSPAWTTEQLASVAGTVVQVVTEAAAGLPMKSAVANTATTIVCPAQLQTIWRVTVAYYTGP